MHEEIVGLMDSMCGPDAHLTDVWLALRNRGEEIAPLPEDTSQTTADDIADLPGEVRVLDALAAAFAYHYRSADHREDPREHYLGGQYRGRTKDPWPPPFHAVDGDLLGVWEEACSRSASAVARARLHDLLFLAHHGDVAGHIHGAVEGYLEQADACMEPLNEADALARALEIAVVTGQQGLQERVTACLLVAADASLAAEDDMPGVTLGLLQPLADARLATAEVKRILADARDRYRDDPWTTDSLIALQGVLANADERDRLDREAAETWLGLADRSKGLGRHMFLQQAARIATERGVTDLRDEAVRQLEAMTLDDLELRTIETSVKVPRDEIDKWIEQALVRRSRSSFGIGRGCETLRYGRQSEGRQRLQA